jgi:tripartite-type tricarboxylate transporter receptor subunit TctC
MRPRAIGWSVMLGAAAILLSSSAFAQDRPADRPVRLIVPYTAGGSADTLARVIAQRVAEASGLPFVVENRTGDGGNIGTEMVARASPDGYTLLMGFTGNLAIGPSYYAALPYEPLKDFAPISHLAAVHNVLVVNPSLPIASIKEFVAHARSNPGKVKFASSSTGSPGHLGGELLNVMAGIKMVHESYSGGSPAIAAVLSGHTHAMFSGAAALPYVKSGKLRALATCGAKRSAVLPEVPTIAESGFPGFEANGWFGMLAPAKTPPATIARLHAEVTAALRVPEIRERLERGGFSLVGSSPEQFQAYMKSEIAKWARVVTVAGVKRE